MEDHRVLDECGSGIGRSVLYASGVIAPESSGDNVLGLIASVLAAMGYSVARGLAKKPQPE